MSQLENTGFFSQFRSAYFHMQAISKDNTLKKNCTHLALGALQSIPLIGMGVDLAEKKWVKRSLESRINAREEMLSCSLSSRSVLFQRLYFEVAARQSPQANISYLDEILGYSMPDLQFMIVQSKVKEYCDANPDHKQALEPVVNTLERCKKCFLGLGCVILETDKKKASALKDELAIMMVKAVTETPRGASAILPAGYLNGSVYEYGKIDGHSIAMEWKCRDDGMFDLLIYNTGEGVELHKQSGLRYLPLTWSKIPKEKVNAELFRELLEFVSPKAQPETPIKTADFIQKVNERLGSYEGVSSNERAYKSQGAISRCTYSCLSVWLHSSINALDKTSEKSLYYHFKYETTDKLLKKIDKLKLPKIGVTYAHPIARIGWTARRSDNVFVKTAAPFLAAIFGKGAPIPRRISATHLNKLRDMSGQALQKRKRRYERCAKVVDDKAQEVFISDYYRKLLKQL